MSRAAAALLALALAACTEPEPPRPDPSPSAVSYAADAPVLSVRFTGGPRPGELLPTVPHWTLYGDGRLISQAPRPAILPAFALPDVRVRVVPREKMDRIVAAAKAAGLDGSVRDLGVPPSAFEAATTVFRLDTGNGIVETRVDALQQTYADRDAPEARVKVADFFRSLDSLDGFGTMGDDEPYRPTSIAVFATTPYRRAPGDVPLGEGEPRDTRWTGPDPATGADTPAGRCLVVSGTALANVLRTLQMARAPDRWHASGRTWAFRLRPLLPGERTCADLVRR